MRSRSTSRRWRRSPTSPKRTSSAPSAPPSGRPRIATSSVAVSSGRCSSCARPTGASRRSASTSASRASGRSAGRSGPSSASRPARIAGEPTPKRSRTASRWRGRDRAVSEKQSGRASTSVAPMLNITHSSIFVLDQDEALDFYVNKLGLEVNTDVDMGFMRWLTVSVPGQPDRQVLLERPGPPAHDEATAERVRELVTKGATGFALGFATDDCRKTYETLRARGVEFTDEPPKRSYGIDGVLRDPFGNHIRIRQQTEWPT